MENLRLTASMVRHRSFLKWASVSVCLFASQKYSILLRAPASSVRGCKPFHTEQQWLCLWVAHSAWPGLFLTDNGIIMLLDDVSVCFSDAPSVLLAWSHPRWSCWARHSFWSLALDHDPVTSTLWWWAQRAELCCELAVLQTAGLINLPWHLMVCIALRWWLHVFFFFFFLKLHTISS